MDVRDTAASEIATWSHVEEGQENSQWLHVFKDRWWWQDLNYGNQEKDKSDFLSYLHLLCLSSSSTTTPEIQLLMVSQDLSSQENRSHFRHLQQRKFNMRNWLPWWLRLASARAYCHLTLAGSKRASSVLGNRSRCLLSPLLFLLPMPTLLASVPSG